MDQEINSHGSYSNPNVPSEPARHGTRAMTTPISPTSFDGAPSGKSRSLPQVNAKNGPGSSHTTFMPPGTSSTVTPPSSAWREPELVEEHESLPSLVPSRTWGNNVEDERRENWSEATPDYNTPWGTAYDAAHIWSKPSLPIDGRNEEEERKWWDVEHRHFKGEWGQRPGSGLLPPMLEEKLHDPDHSLFVVSVTPPDIKPPTPTDGPSASGTRALSSQPPTPQEVLEAIPHPNAHYCRRHNAWFLLAWKSSNVLPPLVVSGNHPPLPSQTRRGQTRSCDYSAPQSCKNKSHHFHEYSAAVDARHLTPGFDLRGWELVRAKESRRLGARRRVTLLGEDFAFKGMDDFVAGEPPVEKVESVGDDEIKPNLLDLYICCQCSFYVVVSSSTSVIPGVILPKYINDFIQEKSRNPPVGKSGEEAVVQAWETVLTAIENKLWKCNHRSLSVNGKVFSQKVGWSLTTRKIFEAIGFSYVASTAADKERASSAGDMLNPPDTDLATAEGKNNRERMLRAWIEISATLVEYQRRFPHIPKSHNAPKLWVKVESAREMYQTAIGAHLDQIPRHRVPEFLERDPELVEAIRDLGMTETSYSNELLHYAYLAQCRCDPANTPTYYTVLEKIVDALRSTNMPNGLETILIEEQSRGRFSQRDVELATRILGFGADNDLRLDFDDDVDDDFILRAWRDATRRSWADPDNGAGRRRDLNDAFRIIAEWRGSKTLHQLWEDDKDSGMTPEKAYSTLEVPQGVDEEMLITVYGMRVEDQPSQLEKMRDALNCIAQFTGSERLAKFLETGSDPGIVVAPTRPDWPRGLNQLGNTCYLNSLLQYFYTIKDLRETIAPLVAASDKYTDDKLNDENLKNHRVGGRVVTRREVIRSRKFVGQLATLFHQLEWSDSPAVTPSLELAKLALVTSKDEEEDDHDGDRCGTDSSHSTDATLVDEGPVAAPPILLAEQRSGSMSPSRSPSSVLGKRSRGAGKRVPQSDDDMEGVEDVAKEKDTFVVIDKQMSPLRLASPIAEKPLGSMAAEDFKGDVQMVERPPAAGSEPRKAPPLPPRPKPRGSTTTSDMMFGKQHDVAECMDNCMFQIETALLQLGDSTLPGSDDAKRSVVKRLFYGKIRQRLGHVNDSGKSKTSIHEREDFFSHLPVNVSDESFDLYDGLSGYFDDVVEFEGRKARMEVALVDLPPILQIQLQRVQFNRETLQPFKSHAYVKFGETVMMDRFLADAPSEKKSRSKAIQAELNACRDRIQALTQGKHAPYSESLENTLGFLSKQEAMTLPEVDGDLLGQLKNEGEAVKDEIARCRNLAVQLKEQLERVWSEDSRAEYELTSVFVHRGASPSFGHYFIYQRWLPDQPDQWFKYNDSDVSVVTKDEVLADTTGSTANPYLLVFARKGAEVIHTVQRTDSMMEDSQQ